MFFIRIFDWLSFHLNFFHYQYIKCLPSTEIKAMPAIEHVILVDENDKEIGTAEKLQAHKESLRHRAFSVFIFRDIPKRELLLQQRANGKYHSPGLWTNTCCSHPRPGEDILASGQRRLREEMGFSLPLTSLGWFHYIAHFDNGLTENEIDYVLVGTLQTEIVKPDKNEVQAYRWISIPDLKQEIAENPERFTPWLALALEMINKNMPQ
jgi:isopentenyl-diphosphate delta-isomerase type 1